MFFSSRKIKTLISEGEIVITPFHEENLKGASYTFTLDNKFKILKNTTEINSSSGPVFDDGLISNKGYQLNPGCFVIFYTKEKVCLNGKYTCLISTRASIAQTGLDISQGSFFCEPDTNNQFALEISNQGSVPVRLYENMKIAKGVFSDLID